MNWIAEDERVDTPAYSCSVRRQEYKDEGDVWAVRWDWQVRAKNVDGKLASGSAEDKETAKVLCQCVVAAMGLETNIPRPEAASPPTAAGSEKTANVARRMRECINEYWDRTGTVRMALKGTLLQMVDELEKP